MVDATGSFIINDHVIATVAYAKKTAIIVIDSTQNNPVRIAAYMDFINKHPGGGFTNVLLIQK